METHKPYGPYEKYFKRPIDVLCGILTVIVFSWLYVILIILGAIFMRGNRSLFKKDLEKMERFLN